MLIKTWVYVFKKNRVEVLAHTILHILSSFLPIISIWCFQKIIDSLVYHQDSMIILSFFCAFFFLSLLTYVISSLMDYFSGIISSKCILQVEIDVLRKLSITRYEKLEDSEFYSDVDRVSNEGTLKPFSIYSSTLTLLTSSLILINSFIYITLINYYYTIVLIILTVISIYWLKKISMERFNIKWDRASDERQSWYIKYIITHDFSFKEIFSYRLFDYFIDSYHNLRNKFISQDIRLLKKVSISNVIYEITVLFINTLLMIAIILDIIHGEATIGILTSVSNIQSSLQNNIKSITSDIYDLSYDKEFVGYVDKFIHDSDMEQQNGTDLIESISSIEFKNLSYRYGGSSVNQLNNINLKIEKGMNVAVIGDNGSGKSTIIKILSKLYSDYTGQVLINGKNINSYNLYSYLKNISVIYQDFMKYETTMGNNVGLGFIEKVHSYDEIKECIKNNWNSKELPEVEEQLGNWFDDGRQLSGGQWQKVAISRLLYNKGSSLLLLDEPTSALDINSSKPVIENIMNMIKETQKIGIFVSHNIPLIKKADLIIILKKGNIISAGTNDYLMKNSIEYINMLKENLRGQEKNNL